MKPITAEVDVFIPRPPEVVFEYFADLRHQPEHNPQVHDIHQTTAGPLALGTRFEGQLAGFGSASWTLVEFDAPRHLAIEGRVGSGTYRWVSDLEAVGEGSGTTLHGRMEWTPGLLVRLFSPVLGALLHLTARRSLGRLAEVLTTSPA